MLAYYNKEFKYRLYPLTIDGCDYEKLPDSPESVFLYDGCPTPEDAAIGAQQLGSYELLYTMSPIAWDDTDDRLGKVFDIPAIPDPDASQAEAPEKEYFIVINTKLDPAGDTLPPIIRQINFTRLALHHSVIDVNPESLAKIDHTIKEYCRSYDSLECYIDSALKELKLSLVGCDMNYVNMWNPEALDLVVSYQALADFFFNQSRNPNDFNAVKAMRYEKKAENTLKKIHLIFDKNKDGKPETVRKHTGFMSIRNRR